MFATADLVLTTLLAAAQSSGVPFLQMWDGDHMDGWGWGGWLTMSVFMVLFWGGVIVLGVWLIRSLANPSHVHDGPASAIDIARERYARGEISDEEYERIRRGLSH